MTAAIIDFVARLDEQEARVSAALGDDEAGELHADGGQALYNRLPEPERRALTRLAFLTRDSGRWPDANLIASVAQHYRADVGAVLCGMSWTPGPGRVLTPLQRECLAVARQVILGLTFELDCHEPADLTA